MQLSLSAAFLTHFFFMFSDNFRIHVFQLQKHETIRLQSILSECLPHGPVLLTEINWDKDICRYLHPL